MNRHERRAAGKGHVRASVMAMSKGSGFRRAEDGSRLVITRPLLTEGPERVQAAERALAEDDRAELDEVASGAQRIVGFLLDDGTLADEAGKPTDDRLTPGDVIWWESELAQCGKKMDTQ